MMGSFSKLVERGQDPKAVTAGLAEALITTVFGLVISIMLSAFSVISNGA